MLHEYLLLPGKSQGYEHLLYEIISPYSILLAGKTQHAFVARSIKKRLTVYYCWVMIEVLAAQNAQVDIFSQRAAIGYMIVNYQHKSTAINHAEILSITIVSKCLHCRATLSRHYGCWCYCVIITVSMNVPHFHIKINLMGNIAGTIKFFSTLCAEVLELCILLIPSRLNLTNHVSPGKNLPIR